MTIVICNEDKSCGIVVYVNTYEEVIIMDNNNVQQPVGQQPEQPGKGKATASMILGIVTLVCIFFGYGALLGIITGIIGLILGIQSKKQAPSGMATAGIVMSAIGLGLCLLAFVACVLCVGAFASAGAAADWNSINLNNLNM